MLALVAVILVSDFFSLQASNMATPAQLTKISLIRYKSKTSKSANMYGVKLR